MQRTLLVGVLALGWTVGIAAAQSSFTTFEAPTYAPGALADSTQTAEDNPGQGGWWRYVNDNLGPAAAIILSGDNGPSEPGTQCLELNNTDPDNPAAANAIGVRQRVTDAITDGPYVTWEYDVKWTVAPDGNFTIRVDDSDRLDRRGLGVYHWWGFAFQLQGSWLPDGSNSAWVGDIGQGPGGIDSGQAGNIGVWHTVRWTAYYGTATGADWGQVLRVEVLNGPAAGYRRTKYQSYLQEGVNSADMLTLWVSNNSAPDIWRLDNLRLTGHPMPSQAPVADAGPDQSNVPMTYDGGVVTLDASGSTDDGSIVEYRWVIMPATPGPGTTVAITSSPQITVGLPSGTHNIRLFVVDDDGLQSFDDVVIQVDATLTPVPVDNLTGPSAIKDGDLFGRDQAPVVLPAGDLQFQIITQVAGGPGGWSSDPPADRQMVFDRLGNMYAMRWYDRVVSATPDFAFRWESPQLRDAETSVVMVGDRHVYVVDGGDQASFTPCTVTALDKVTGQIVWDVWLEDLGIPATEIGLRPLATLHNNKLYVVGAPFDGSGDSINDSVRLWQVDLGTDTPGFVPGALDWTAIVPWGSEAPRYGNVVLIPDLFAAGEHGLYFAGRSAAADDGLPDLVGVRLNDSGVVSTWGADGVLADLSALTYSPDAGVLYVRSQSDNWGNVAMWVVDPFTGDKTGAAVGDQASTTYNEEAMALGGDGVTLRSAGKNGWVYSFTPTTFDAAFYDFENNAGENAILFRNAAGEDILVTGVRGREGAHDQVRRLVALNLSQADSAVADEGDLDDGPVYIDDVVVYHNGNPVFSDNFESYPLGPIVAPGIGPWVYTTYAPGQVDDWTAAIVSIDGRKCLRLDPYGGNGNRVTSLVADLGADYGPPSDTVALSWMQKRTDLCDNVYIGDFDGAPGTYQWDGGGAPASQKLYATGGSPGWTPSAELTPGAWQAVYLSSDYVGDWIDVTVDGTNNGEAPPFIADLGNGLATVELWMWATPPTCSGWEPLVNEPVDEIVLNTEVSPDNFDWEGISAISVGPDGSIYFFQWKTYDRRWTRVKLVSTGPSYVCGDTNCDGVVDTADIDNFVFAVVNNTPAPGCPTSLLAADANKDGAVDTADIDSFVYAVVNGICP